MQRYRSRVALAALVFLGCAGKKPDQDRAAATAAASGQPDAGISRLAKEGPPKPPPVKPAELKPVIHELGGAGVVPTAIVIELARPVVDKSAVGEQSKTEVTMTPAAAGKVSWTGASTLTFTPAEPFAFGTKYTFEVTKLETRDGVIAPPEGEHWRREFATPAFAFLRWAPVDVDTVKHRVTMAVTFSGAVLPNRAKPFLLFTVEGKPVAGVAFSDGARPNVIEAVLTDPRFVLGARVALAVKKGLPAAASAKAEAASVDYFVSNDRAVVIKGARLDEGAQGFFLEVICDDKAAASGDRSYYANGDGGDGEDGERENYYGLSERCQLTDEALARVQIEPPLKKPYLTGGRAGFRIFGEWKRGPYAVTIPAGLTSVDGGVVLAPFEGSYSVPARKPQLSFAASGRYLPRSAWSNLGIKHLNVEAVNLFVRQVPPENLVFWLSGEGSERADDRTSDLVLKKTLPLRAAPDEPTTTWIDVGALLPATTKGVLEVKLDAVGVGATARLLLTNMSLIAKKSAPPAQPWNQQVLVWALDIDSGKLIDGVDVTLVRRSGKTVARCKTDGDMGCVLDAASPDELDTAEPFALIARKGDDLTYIRYKDLKADVAEAHTTGEPFRTETPYHAALWPDRGVYRPGDTAHVVAVVRTAKDVAPEAGLPLDVKLSDPRAKVVRKQTLRTNAAGLITIDYPFAAFADTGRYDVELSIAEKKVGTAALQVEEFVPERMRVTAAAKKAAYLPDDEVEIDIAAEYLFGGTAEGSGATLTCTLEPTRFDPTQNGELTYGVAPKGKPVPLGEEKGELDANGKATVTCPGLDDKTGFTQTGRLTATVGVLEAGSGRATVKEAHTTVHPEKFYLGLKASAQTAHAGKTFTVSGLVVDWTGAPAPGALKQVEVEYAHLDREYGYRYNEGDDESSYEKLVHPVSEGKTRVKVEGGKFSFDVTPGQAPVGYLVRVKAGRAVTELALDGDYPFDYRYDEGGGQAADQTPRPNRPTALVLEVPKEIQVGQPVPVKLLAPYRGRLLFTVETDRVVIADWVEVQGGEVKWSFTPSEFAPNVYVSAFLVKDPHAESKEAYLPDRAFGVASARVLPTALTQELKLDAPKAIRSASPLTIKLDTGATEGATFATVAVVDEGILQLTDYRSPDPLARLVAKRALGVETYETIGWTLLHPPAGASSATGGGDEEEAGGKKKLEQGRVQPVRPVAFFSGLVAVDASGKAQVTFDIPTYRGELRVMAVTVSPTRIGHADAHVTVKDPLVVLATLPRFVTQNDELQIPVALTNLSGGPLEVSVALTGETLPVAGMTPAKDPPPPLVFLGKATGSLRLENGKAQTVVFQARATLPVGAARLKVVAKAKGAGGSFEAHDELDVPFEPAGPKERVVKKLRVESGTTSLAAVMKGWVPTSEVSTFWLTANPYGESFEHLAYLVHYPYGCIEQTTSATRPLLFVANLLEQVDPKLAEARLEDMVLAGVNRILAMQTPSGGLGYWPGATEPLEWGTAYATHLLLDAKKLGYPVPEDRLGNILTWIENRAAAYERGDTVAHREYHYDDRSEAYLHYVLALAGRGHKARIQKLIEGIPATAKGEDAEHRYLLMAALYLAGDRRHEKELRTPDVSAIASDRTGSWSFYSDRRRRGFMLSTFFDLFGHDPAGEPLAERVAEGLAGERSSYYNTQELVWGVTGLGKWVAGAAKDFKPGQLLADGQAVVPRAPKHKTSEVTWGLVRASEYKSLALTVPEKSEGALFLVVASEGVRTEPTAKEGGEGLSVSRTFRGLSGTEVSLTDGSLKLGDLVFVELELANTSGDEIKNLALVDRLPAGFEIENPRLGRATTAEWIDEKEQWQVDYLNLRDDRIEAFGSLPASTGKKVIYTVRVVTSGKFTVPPVEAGAMYDPTLWARKAGGPVVISGPWEGHLL